MRIRIDDLKNNEAEVNSRKFQEKYSLDKLENK